MYQGIGPEIDGIFLPLFLCDGHHCRITRQSHRGYGIHIVKSAGKPVDVAGSICQLHVPQHLYIGRIPVEIQGVAPRFLGIGHQMHLPAEKEKFAAAVIPPVLGRKHVVLFPGIGPGPESGQGRFRLVFQGIGLDEDGVSEHIDVSREIECLYFRIIRTRLTFYDLSVLVPHGTSAEKDGDTVFRIVIQELGAQSIPVLVLKLDHVSAELGQVGIDVVFHLLAVQLGLVLDDLHVPDGIYHSGIHIPECGVAEKIGVVVKESGRTHYLPVAHAVDLQKLGALSAQQAHKTVLRLLLLFLG